MKKRFYQLGKKVVIISAVSICAMFSSNQTFAQGVSINATGTGTAPHVSAILDLSDVADKGFLTPHVDLQTVADAMGNATVKEGLLIYNTGATYGTAGFYYNDAATGPTPNWVPISSSSGTITGTGTVNQVARWTPSTTALDDSRIFDDGTNSIVISNTITPTPTSATSLLEVQANDKGVLIPRVALDDNADFGAVGAASAAAMPTSLLIYNTYTTTPWPNSTIYPVPADLTNALAVAVKEGFYFWSVTDKWIAIASNLPNPSAQADGNFLSWSNSLQTYTFSPLSFTGTISTMTGDMQITGSIRSTSSGSYSDVRLKRYIKPVESALDKVLQMNGVTYQWNQEKFPERKLPDGVQYGVIAQDVEKIVPELVKTGEDGFKSVEYANMASLFIEAIKEQQKIIESQKSDISVLKVALEEEKNNTTEQLSVLMSRINSLERSVEVNTNKAEK